MTLPVSCVELWSREVVAALHAFRNMVCRLAPRPPPSPPKPAPGFVIEVRLVGWIGFLGSLDAALLTHAILRRTGRHCVDDQRSYRHAVPPLLGLNIPFSHGLSRKIYRVVPLPRGACRRRTCAVVRGVSMVSEMATTYPGSDPTVLRAVVPPGSRRVQSTSGGGLHRTDEAKGAEFAPRRTLRLSCPYRLINIRPS